MRRTARIASDGPSGIAADGEAPECCGAIRTRRVCGLDRNRSGGVELRRLAVNSGRDRAIGADLNDGADHSSTGL